MASTSSAQRRRVRVVELYKARGMSQESLAALSGVSQSGISRYVAGGTVLPEKAAAIAAALGTSTAYLDGSTDDPAPPSTDHAPDEDTLENALLRALDKRRHTLADARAVEDVLRSGIGLAKPISLDVAAAAWLDAAAHLRRAHIPVTVATLLMRVTDALSERTRDLNSNGDSELAKLGGSPPTEPAKIPR